MMQLINNIKKSYSLLLIILFYILIGCNKRKESPVSVKNLIQINHKRNVTQTIILKQLKVLSIREYFQYHNMNKQKRTIQNYTFKQFTTIASGGDRLVFYLNNAIRQIEKTNSILKSDRPIFYNGINQYIKNGEKAGFPVVDSTLLVETQSEFKRCKNKLNKLLILEELKGLVITNTNYQLAQYSTSMSDSINGKPSSSSMAASTMIL